MDDRTRGKVGGYVFSFFLVLLLSLKSTALAFEMPPNNTLSLGIIYALILVESGAQVASAYIAERRRLAHLKRLKK